MRLARRRLVHQPRARYGVLRSAQVRGEALSAPEHVQEQDPIGSRVKLTRNAKGEPQWEISVREGSSEEEITRIRGLAVAAYRELEREFAGKGSGINPEFR